MKDNEGRNIDYLRISVTDRCNLRCIYCMPEEGVDHIVHEEILTYEEIVRIARASSALGVKKIRLTGGEPLVRKGISGLIRELKGIDGIEEVSITTNGVLLPDMIDELADAGLNRVNLSLDSLKADKFRSITRHADLSQVFEGMERALELRIKVRINVVLIKGINDDEVHDFVDLIKTYPVDVRFIELMPIGRGTEYDGISNEALIECIIASGNDLEEIEYKAGNGPARYFELDGAKGDLGFISPMSHQFCETCNRIRLTPEGFLKLCLHSGHGIDLRRKLRSGIDDAKLVETLRLSVVHKPTAHRFNEASADQDDRSMNRIGG